MWLTGIVFVLTVLSPSSLALFPRTRSSTRAKEKCEAITLPHCSQNWYNRTSMPNLLGHESQSQAAKLYQDFVPLINIGCSDELQFFLCSIFTPICLPDFEPRLLACKAVCRRVQRGCRALLVNAGIPWPSFMDCGNFPDYEEGSGICMDPKASRKNFQRPKTKSLSSYEPVTEEMLESQESHESRGDFQRKNSKTNANRPCKSYQNEGDEGVLTTALLWLSASCLLISVAATVSHINASYSAPERRTTPQALAVYINVCYIVCSLAFLMRVLWGHRATSCLLRETSLTSLDLEVAAGSRGAAVCLTSFTLLHLGLSAAASWFAALCFAWAMFRMRLFDRQLMARFCKWFHASVWLISLLETSLAAATSQVSGEPTSGFCFLDVDSLPGFYVVPTAGKVILCIVFLGIGISANTTPRNDQLTEVGPPMSLLCPAFLLPTVAAVVFFLVKVDTAAAEARDESSSSSSSSTSPVYLAILQYTLLVSPGILCGLISIASALPNPLTCATKMLRLAKRSDANHQNRQEMPLVPVQQQQISPSSSSSSGGNFGTMRSNSTLETTVNSQQHPTTQMNYGNVYI